MQHATVLFVLNNACLRPRNTGIITMSWPQKITSSSSELIQLVQLCQLECTAVCNPSGKKIFNCFRACDKVSAERGTQGDDLWIHHQTPGGASLDNRWSRYIFNFTASQRFIDSHSRKCLDLTDAGTSFSVRSSHIFHLTNDSS